MRSLVALLLLCLWSTTATAQEADLRIDGRPVYNADGSVRLTAVVTNSGPDAVMDVDITVQFDIAAATASELPTGCTGSSIGVVCSFTEIDAALLSADEELAVELVVTPEGEGDITLNVRSSTDDPDESNNEDTVPLVPPSTVDVALDERGLQEPNRNTLVFSARNNGPDVATGIAVMGTVTIDFLEAIDAATAEQYTTLSPNDDAVCGRQVPDSEGNFDRWTFPVSCSVRDLEVDEEIEFRFVFDQGDNAVFRLTATSDGLDTDLANNVTDGDFLNSPLEVIEGEEDGCCATTKAAPSSIPVLLFLGALMVFRRRPCVRSAI